MIKVSIILPTYNGEKFKVTPETCYGYSDKNWGRGFTSPWVWLSSCNITSNITGKKLEVGDTINSENEEETNDTSSEE